MDAAGNRVFHEQGTGQIWVFDIDNPSNDAAVNASTRTSVMTVEPFTQKIYWGDPGVTSDRKVKRSDFDGSRIEEVYDTGSWAPEILELDPHRHKIYWGGSSSVSEVSLVTKESTVLYSGPGARITDVAFDPIHDKLYWTENDNHVVKRSNLDGSNVEPLIDPFPSPWQVEVVVCIP